MFNHPERHVDNKYVKKTDNIQFEDKHWVNF